MSWYVRFLLQNVETIREGIINPANIFSPASGDEDINADQEEEFDEEYSSDVHPESLEESDTYNDLLIVEKKIKELYQNKELTSQDLKYISTAKSDTSIVNAARNSQVDRSVFSTKFFLICAKIAESLGGMFTDDGYAEYLAEKYNLTISQKNKVREYISTHLRF